MAKCGVCRSCLRIVTLSPNKYLVCNFCKTVYTLENGELEIVFDPEIIQRVGEKTGWKIE